VLSAEGTECENVNGLLRNVILCGSTIIQPTLHVHCNSLQILAIFGGFCNRVAVGCFAYISEEISTSNFTWVPRMACTFPYDDWESIPLPHGV
jgi:hypothetical protein